MSDKAPSLGMWDDFDEILKAGDIDAIGFDFGDGNTPRANVAKMAINMEQLITRQDEEWSEVYQHNTEKLRHWKLRHGIFYLALHRVRHILTSEETPDWEEAARCLGFMNAFRVASEQALAIVNERAEQSDQGGA
jgi:hypothetical protein